MADENSPLLESSFDRDMDDFDNQSKRTTESQNVERMLRQRFWWFCILGVAAIVALQLSFLPRTSCNRDFRRWYDLHLTKTDVKRLFLVQLQRGRPEDDGLTVEDHVDHWLGAFSMLNAKTTAGISALTAPELAAMVQQNMRDFGFETNSHIYPLSPLVKEPLLLAVRLVDMLLGRVLYNAKTHETGSPTPAFFPFGANGSVEAPLTFARAGTPEDFLALERHGLSVAGRIVVFSHLLTSDYLLADKIALAEQRGCAAVVVYGDVDAEDAISRNFKPFAVPGPGIRIPLSYSAAQPILSTLGPAMEPFQNWPYAPQPLDDTLCLQVAAQFAPDLLYATNIVGLLEGVLNDGVILVGASRDILTSSNPLSGHAIMLEVMRRFQLLRNMGWRPLRAIRFVSWDASRSAAQGSHAMVLDSSVLKTNLPVLAYINLDEDVVMGDHFSVDANPLFNNILRYTAKFVPFPRNSTHYRRMSKNDNAMFSDDEEDDDISLYHYWYKQSKAYINNRVGSAFAGKDASSFQSSFAGPTINIKFAQSPNHNDSLYVPESSFYSLDWLSQNVDKAYALHSLLVRFLGLLVLSLGEHEVVDYKTADLFQQAQSFFLDFVDANKDTLKGWEDEVVHDSLLSKSTLLADLKDRMDGDADKHTQFKFRALVQQMKEIFGELQSQSEIYDAYNVDVQEMWIEDYPWYKMFKKAQIYAKFKVTNYKLLRIEKGLTFTPDETEKTGGVNETHHLMYEVPQGQHSRAVLHQRGAFASMYEAAETGNMERMIKIMVGLYERLKSIYKKIS